MSQYGEGTFHREGNGWVGRKMIGGKRIKRRGKTKAEVKAKLDAAEQHYGDTGTALDPRQTVEQMMTEWWNARGQFDRHGAECKPNTLDARHYAMTHVINELGDRLASRVTTEGIEQALRRLARPVPGVRRGNGQSSQKKIRWTLAQAYDYAIDRGRQVKNPAKRVQLQLADAPRQRARRALHDAADIERLWIALGEHEYGASFQLQLAIGLRPGEVAGLRWSSIRDGIIRVESQATAEHGVMTLKTDLKTSSSDRRIALPPEAVDILKRQRRRVASMKLAADEWFDHDLVFPGRSGLPLDASHRRTILADICKSIDLPHLSPNELRHTCATRLANQGVPMAAVADMLGHTDMRMLETVYRHAAPVATAATMGTPIIQIRS